MKRLENKVAVITGGSRELGKTTAKLFLDEGAKVVLVDINKETLKNVSDSLKSPNLSYISADVTKAADVQS